MSSRSCSPRLRPTASKTSTLTLAAGALLLGCVSAPTRGVVDHRPTPAQVTGVYAPGVPTSHPPFTQFNANWKTRADAHYVYFEHVGNYIETPALIPSLIRELTAQGLEADGPPFTLYFDDPAVTPRAELRSRVCMPITGARSPQAPLRYEVLPQVNVAYAVISGPYPDAPRAYPHLFKYMDGFNWEADGPIREIYIVAPSAARDPRDLLCELQIPVATRR
jgi:effector-binding domain-containing protein